MASSTGHLNTLYDFLTCANPTLIDVGPRQFPSSHPKPGNGLYTPSYTRNKKWPVPMVVRPWIEFDKETILEIFDKDFRRHLEREVNDLPPLPPVHEAVRSVNYEAAFDAIVARWHNMIVLEALQRTSLAMIDQNVGMVKGGQALLVFDDSNRFTPDWAGTNDVKRNDSIPQPNNILPGDTKTSWTWSSAQMLSDFQINNWPLRQVLFYCLRSCSRYGYLLTDEELVVLRLSNGEQAPEAEHDAFKCQVAVKRRLVVEYETIPWSASGRSGGMTINLALWALHILAANDGRLETTPYCDLRKEKKVPRASQVAIEALQEKLAPDSGKSARSSPGQQSFEGRLPPSCHPNAIWSDTEDDDNTERDTDDDRTGEEDAAHHSQPSSFRVPNVTEARPKRLRRSSRHGQSVSRIKTPPTTPRGGISKRRNEGMRKRSTRDLSRMRQTNRNRSSEFW